MAAEGYRVELFVRGTVPPEVREHQERTVGELQAIGGEYDVDVEVSHWPREIPVEPVGAGEPYLDMLKTFRAWAHARGCSLAPAVDTRRTYSWITAEQYVSVALPMVLLAVYDGDDIAGVYPHADGDEVATVDDGIEALREFCAGDRPVGRTALVTSD